MVIYGDSLFLLNFTMDSWLLFLTGLFMRLRPAMWRIAIGSVLLALYGTLMFFPNLTWLYTTVGKICVSAALIIPVYGKQRGRIWLKLYAVFWIVSIVAGGIAFALFMLTRFGDILDAVISNGTLYLDIPITLLWFALICTYAVIWLLRHLCIRCYSRERLLVDLELTHGTRTQIVTGLIDTGCELTMPWSEAPVLIVEKEVLETFELGTPLFLPIVTASGEGPPLEIFYLDSIRSMTPEYIVDPTAMVAVAPGRLSHDGLYRAILNPDVLRNCNDLKGAKAYAKSTRSQTDTNDKQDSLEAGASVSQICSLHRRK